MDVAPHSTPLPILYVITKGTWGGAQRYVYDLAVAAKARGHVVTVACGGHGELVRRLTEDGIPVVLIPGLARDVRLGADIRALIGLIRLIHKERPNIVHANSSKAGLIAMLAARMTFVPRILFTAHGWAWNELRPRWQKTMFKLLHFLTVLLAKQVIAVSNAIREDALWMRLAAKKIQVVHLGISPLQLVPRAQSRDFLEHTIGTTLPSSALWIGALAELHPTKGLDVLIRAFASLTETETVLILIGGGEDRGRLVALAHMLKVESRVFFVGHIQDAARILPALDVFVLPSHSEALGYVLLEAGQSNLPVIASNVGGIPEIISNEVTGLLFPSGDHVVLASHLRTYSNDPLLRTQYGQSLHDRVLTEFSNEGMLEKTFSLYEGQ